MKNRLKSKWRILSMLLMLAMIISCVNVNTTNAKAKKAKKVVILYFSATGTTKGVAKRIQKATKGKLIGIKAEQPYSEDDLDYDNEESRVNKEHESADTPAMSSVRPQIANLDAVKNAVKKADVVYIGYPIWWGEAPHIIYTLVENINLKKKTVVPFSTSISSGLGSSAKHLEKSAKISPKTKWIKGRNFFGIPSQKKVNKWIKSM